MIDPEHQPICWIVSDGSAGHEGQALGLAERAGLMPVLRRLPPRTPLSRLRRHLGLARIPDWLRPPWPPIAIGAGTDATAPLLRLRAASGGATRIVQIFRPHHGLEAIDLVVAPDHDGLTGPNVLATCGAMTRVTAGRLAAAGAAWAERLSDLPHPRLAVLLGAPPHGPAGRRAVVTLLDRLDALARAGWGLMVTTSRRTPAADAALIRDRLAPLGAFLWTGGEGENPYFGFLAHADAILVSGDSINMTSEAASTGRPVHVLHWTPPSTRFRHFHDALEAAGISKPFEGEIGHWRYTPLDETGRAARRIRDLLGLPEAPHPNGRPIPS